VIDITFDFRTDTPGRLDPDKYSPLLRKYHKLLWSKPLPGGKMFDLSDALDLDEAYLYHKSELGEFRLSSDTITHPYFRLDYKTPIYTWKVWPHKEILSQLPENTVEEFWASAYNIGGFIIFPGRRIDNLPTMNQERGCNALICDRFDLTLECIRLFYEGKPSPLHDTLQRYKSFFDLFEDFKGYVAFFLLQDMVGEDCEIKFFLEFDDFRRSPLPQSAAEYLSYRDKMAALIQARGRRMKKATDK